MFTIITPAQRRTRQNGYVTMFYLKHSYVFVLKVRESLIKQLKITVKKIFESTLRVRKLVILQKILFERNNFAKNDLHTP